MISDQAKDSGGDGGRSSREREKAGAPGSKRTTATNGRANTNSNHHNDVCVRVCSRTIYRVILSSEKRCSKWKIIRMVLETDSVGRYKFRTNILCRVIKVKNGRFARLKSKKNLHRFWYIKETNFFSLRKQLT